MNTKNNTNQIVEDLLRLATLQDLSDERQLISQIIQTALQDKNSLINDIQGIIKSGYESFAFIIESKIKVNPEYNHIKILIWDVLNFILNASIYLDDKNVGEFSTMVRNYILVLIGDSRKIQDYINTPITYSISNPDKNFWFLRSDTNGTHIFNSNNNYLINSIPNASASIYSNAEIYNNAYTNIMPKCAIATSFPVDKIINVNELQNYFTDLFLNIPFSASHRVVFEAQIKVENLKGGSRGWGFWNTHPLPIVGMQAAWFIQQQNQIKETIENQFQIWTFHGTTIDIHHIPVPLDEEWHSYKILLDKNSVSYYMDNNLIHEVNTKFSGPMAFHNWVDNAFFDIVHGKKVLQNSIYPRTNFTKSMKIYTEKT